MGLMTLHARAIRMITLPCTNMVALVDLSYFERIALKSSVTQTGFRENSSSDRQIARFVLFQGFGLLGFSRGWVTWFFSSTYKGDGHVWFAMQ